MRTGIIVANKVDGKYYKVTNVSVQDGNQVGTAYKLCDNPDTPDTPFGCDEELGEDWVLITEKNALAFRLVSDPEPSPGTGRIQCIQWQNREKRCICLRAGRDRGRQYPGNTAGSPDFSLQ